MFQYPLTDFWPENIEEIDVTSLSVNFIEL